MSALGILSVVGLSLLMQSAVITRYLDSVIDSLNKDLDDLKRLQPALIICKSISKMLSAIGVWLLVICGIISLVKWFTDASPIPLP